MSRENGRQLSDLIIHRHSKTCLFLSLVRTLILLIFRYYQKVPEELPELELKATFGLVAPLPFEVPPVHAIFTEEAYKDFTVQQTPGPKIVSRVKL